MAAVTVEQSDIRGLDIDKTVKGFALIEYVFKSDCTVTTTKADSIRWYQETAADLTGNTTTGITSSPIANVSPLSIFPTVEVSWTRNTTYVRKYAAEGFLSMEDMQSADIDVLARSLLRLTRAVVKQVDTRIWNVLTENRSPTTIYMIDTSGAWSAGVGSDPIKDFLFAREHLISGGYTQTPVVAMGQVAYRHLMDWLIWTKGSSIPQFASDMTRNGTMTSLLGIPIKVSPNCTADYAVMYIPQTSCTWKSFTDTTSRVIEDPGLGSKIRVWEIGEAYITDPKSIVLISNTS